jgi:2-succinyl-5-enolpyruvyl-6-hydroxy-3-cyclohexene-1-carboxylate synthase
MAYALAEASAAGKVELLVRIDERSAGFTALGLALATGAPVAVLTTSGTAVGNLLPAVMEANHAAVPLVVLSADRPDELRGTGANQTTIQLDLFGEHVRFAVDIPAGESPQRAVETSLSRRDGCLRGHTAGTGAAQPRLPRPFGARQAGERLPEHRGHGTFRIGTEPLTMTLDPAPADASGTAHRGPCRARRRSGRRGLRPRPRAAAAGRAIVQLTFRAQRCRTVPAAAGALRPGFGAAHRTRAVVFGRPTLSRPVSALLARTDVPAALYQPVPVAWYEPGRRRSAHRKPGRTRGVRRTRLVRMARRLAARRRRGPARASTACLHRQRPPPVPAVGSLVWQHARGQLVLGSSNGIRDVDLAGQPMHTSRTQRSSPAGASPGSTAPSPPPPASPWGGRQETTLLLGDVTFLHDAGGLLLGAGEERAAAPHRRAQRLRRRHLQPPGARRGRRVRRLWRRRRTPLRHPALGGHRGTRRSVRRRTLLGKYDGGTRRGAPHRSRGAASSRCARTGMGSAPCMAASRLRWVRRWPGCLPARNWRRASRLVARKMPGLATRIRCRDTHPVPGHAYLAVPRPDRTPQARSVSSAAPQRGMHHSGTVSRDRKRVLSGRPLST